MPPILVDILRLGFPGLAAYFLYLSYKLSKQIVSLQSGKGMAEKRRAVNLFGLLCILSLVLSIVAEFGKGFIKPPIPWIAASALGQFSEEELNQRPLELSTWLANEPDTTFKYFRISRQPNRVEIPSSGGMVLISVPRVTESPREPSIKAATILPK